MRKVATSIAIGVIFIIFASQSVSAEKYTVKQGDNLWNISEKYDISITELMKINELDTVIIRPEQEIYIYEMYKVERGDTLSAIGKKYSVSVEQLQEWNDLSSDLIITGQELVIHALHDDLKAKEKAKAKEREVSKQKSKSETATKAQPKEEKQSSGQTMTVTATAYTAQCDGCSGITYTGVNLNEDRHAKVIAVDPNVIPLGSKVYVEGYGEAIAADIGGAIKGNKIDIHVPTKDEAYEWGVRTVNVTILD
ncbi:MAG TPA: LysM peptidoglycan-binding domain-containing protein [Bacillota bacterium]|nr:LysM peptidoglycan-binding domain-containing protein [Bacillota bacterium]